MIKKKLALSRDWLLDMSNIDSNKLPMHPLAYWAQSPEIWKDLSNLDETKKLLVYVLRFSKIDNDEFKKILNTAQDNYNLFFLSLCLDSYTHYEKQEVFARLQQCIEIPEVLGNFLQKTNPLTFYESLNNQAQLQAVFCETIKLLPSYDEISAKLCKVV